MTPFPRASAGARAAQPPLHRPLSWLAMAALATALALSAVKPAPAQQAGAISVEQPWTRATPPGAKVAGGFAVIVNGGDAPDRLVSVTAEVSGRVEIHEMAVTDGVVTMRPLPDGVAVPAGGSVELKPGSYHLMLMDLAGPLKAGESFAGTFTFEKAGTVPVEFTVAPIGAKAPAAAHTPH